jgi:hypothetical protein
VKGHEIVASFYAFLAVLCLGAAAETWVMGALGGGLAVVAAVAWFWKPTRRKA